MRSEKDPKFVYYLSAEFLMGRSLMNAVQNLELTGTSHSRLLRKTHPAILDVSILKQATQRSESLPAVALTHTGSLMRLASDWSQVPSIT